NRAKLAVRTLNDFMDSVPELYHVSVGSDGWVTGRGRPLFQVTPQDAPDFAADLKSTSLAMRKAVFAVSLGVSMSGRSGQA
ncbi:hypothetical protein ABTM86_19625, partial [Acinetobacter baumannii]